MKKTYKIEVDCANCASIMENTSKKICGVQNVVINFITQKITVDFCDGSDETAVMKQIFKACKKVESDCVIYF